MSQAVDEITHLMMQMSRQETGDIRLVAIGHVTSYDPTHHAVRVALPTFRVTDNGEDTQEPIQTPWIQLGSPWVGKGSGFQAAPHPGGATPGTWGDQAAIFIVEREQNTAVVATLLYNQIAPPPDSTLVAGEAVLRHDSGSLLKFFQNGNVNLNVAGVLTIAVGQVTMTVSNGNVAIVIPSGDTVSINGTSDALALVSKLVAAFNTHTHPDPQGGDTGAPSAQWTPETIQSVLAKVGG